MRIGVVVINYRSEERTLRFVREELSKISAAHAVVVVDNGSTDETSARLAAGLADGAQQTFLVPSRENLGFAKGNNLGFEFAEKHFRPDLVLFSNNDVRFTEPDLVERLAEKLQSLPDAAVIGPKVSGLDGKLQSPAPFISFWNRHVLVYWANLIWSDARKRERLALDYAEHARQGYHYIVSGCFFLVKAADYRACGGMDPNTFLYAEEMILAERLRRIGKRIYYFPEVGVLHEHGAVTTETFTRDRIRRQKLESDIYYYKTYVGTPRWQFLIARFTLFLKKCFHR